MSIQIQGLTKLYGEQIAVNKIDLNIPSGQVLGFLGPNGAGKSTTMKMITCYLTPSAGQIKVCGIDTAYDSMTVRKKIGYLPESNPLYRDMYVREYLDYVARIYQISHRSSRVQEMILMTGLDREKDKKIHQLSKGYKQRVGIAQAMIHNPEVLILDEPTSGLDPNQIDEIRKLIIAIGKEKTVMLSTHIMQEVEAMCDRVVIIHQGNIVADNTTENLKKSSQKETIIHIEFQDDIDPAILQTIASKATVKKHSGTVYSIHTESSHEDMRPALFQLAVSQQWTIVNLTQEEKNLESVFKELTSTNT